MYALPVSLKLIDIIAISETSDYIHICVNIRTLIYYFLDRNDSSDQLLTKGHVEPHMRPIDCLDLAIHRQIQRLHPGLNSRQIQPLLLNSRDTQLALPPQGDRCLYKPL